MRTSTIAIVTGADERYFGLLTGLVQSLRKVNAHARCDLVVLDFGLAAEQVSQLKNDWSVSVVSPECVTDIPPKFALPRFFGFSLRCALPRIAPGYDVYLWMDSDTWVQDDLFIQALATVALNNKLAIVAETDRAYAMSPTLTAWNLKNQVRAFGLRDGLQVFLAPPINSGVFAARGDHPVWRAWESRFVSAVRRADKIIAMDQHALKAAIRLDRIDVEYLDASFNWLCSRSAPTFDPRNQHFCVSRPPFKKLSVLHLAGNSKAPNIVVPLLGGGSTTRSVLFGVGDRFATLPQ